MSDDPHEVDRLVAAMDVLRSRLTSAQDETMHALDRGALMGRNECLREWAARLDRAAAAIRGDGIASSPEVLMSKIAAQMRADIQIREVPHGDG